jgi:hypothetical protein
MSTAKIFAKYAYKFFKGANKPLRNAKKIVHANKKMFETASKEGKNYQLKLSSEFGVPINPLTLNKTKPSMTITKDLLENNKEAQGELGNMALRLSEKYQKSLNKAQEEMSKVFTDFKVSARAKGANSVYSKLERNITKKGVNISTDAQAMKCIEDGIGGRIQMPSLKEADVNEVLHTMKFNGKTFTEDEINIIKKSFSGGNLTAEEAKFANSCQRNVRLALAERQSAPVVKQMMTSAWKHALDKKLVTIEELEKRGISSDIIKELKSGKEIQPLRIKEINNYSGKDGIPYFSDAQIFQIQEYQAITKEPIDIISVPELKRSYPESLLKNEQKAIKASGYTTAQFNTVLDDGTVAEIQIRGSESFAEYQHPAYDALQEKHTLSSTFNDYIKKVKAMSKDEYKEYDKYFNKCFNRERDIELGLGYREKPKLPDGFDEILNQDSMKNLHEKAKEKSSKAFRTSIELVA